MYHDAVQMLNVCSIPAQQWQTITNVVTKYRSVKFRTKYAQNRKTNRNADCRISPPPLPFPPQKHTWSGLRRRARQQMTSWTGAGLRSNICSAQNAPATSQSLMKHRSLRGIGESRYPSVSVPTYHSLTHTHIDKQSKTHTHHITHTLVLLMRFGRWPKAV